MQQVFMSDLISYIGKKVKDFAVTPIRGELVIIFDDNTALWFHKKPYAIGSVREMERRDEKNQKIENEQI